MRARRLDVLVIALCGACGPVAEAGDGTDEIDTESGSGTGDEVPCTYLYFEEPARQKSLELRAVAPPALADMDGDGFSDILVPIDDGTIRILRSEGADHKRDYGGIFDHTNHIVEAAGLGGFVATDWSGDGTVDLITSNGGASVWRNAAVPGDFEFQAIDSDETPIGSTQGVALADMNLDGDLETVVWSAFGVTVWPGPDDTGELGMAWSNEMEPGNGSRRGVVEDIDGDEFPDVVVAATQKSTFLVVYRNDGAGGVLPAETYAGDFSGLQADVVDLDGDGAKDVIVAGGGAEADGFPATGPAFIAWMRNRGDGVFEEADLLELSPGWNAWSVTHTDLDGDGRPELLVMTGGDLVGGTETGGLHVLSLENGKLVPTPPGFVEHDPSWAYLELADVDDDGLLDLVTVSGAVHVLWGCR